MYNLKKFSLIIGFSHIFFCNYLVAADPTNIAETVANLVNSSAASTGVDVAKEVVSDTSGLGGPVPGPLFDQYKQVFKAVGTIGMLASLTRDTGRAACAIKSYVKPSDEEIVRALRVEEAYHYLLARKNFRNCLVENVRGKQNAAGRPEVCEQLVRMFVLAGGSREVETMLETFKKVHAQHRANA